MAVYYRNKGTGTIRKFREPNEKPTHLARARRLAIKQAEDSPKWEKIDVEKQRGASKEPTAPEKK